MICLMFFVVTEPLKISHYSKISHYNKYYPNFAIIKKPKSEEFQFSKKVLHITPIFCNSVM